MSRAPSAFGRSATWHVWTPFFAMLLHSLTVDALEKRLDRFIRELAVSDLLHTGDILDAGCNDGTDAKALAKMFKPRTVLAMDPLKTNVDIAKTVAATQANMQVLWGGLGAVDGLSSYGVSIDTAPRARRQLGKYPQYQARQTDETKRVNFSVYALDTLFVARKLAFAHWDVEGYESDVLRGARTTVLRDQPLFTVETYPAQTRAYTELLRLIAAFEYVPFAIRESCGFMFVPDGSDSAWMIRPTDRGWDAKDEANMWHSKLWHRDSNCVNLVCAPRARLLREPRLVRLLSHHAHNLTAITDQSASTP